jgi:hypothetical protein
MQSDDKEVSGVVVELPPHDPLGQRGPLNYLNVSRKSRGVCGTTTATLSRDAPSGALSMKHSPEHCQSNLSC